MQDRNYDFFKYRKVTSGLSIALVAMSALFFGVLGLNYGIDFKGGSMIMIKDNKTAVVADYREVLNSMNLGDFNITEVFDPSKSLGNSPDPLERIAKYGADGLRHGIMSIAPKGQDIRFSEERIEQAETSATSFGMFAGLGKCLVNQKIIPSLNLFFFVYRATKSRRMTMLFCFDLPKLWMMLTGFTQTMNSILYCMQFIISFGQTFVTGTLKPPS